MESESKIDTPGSSGIVWSPDVLFANHPHGSGTGMTSTPYWPPSYKKLNESEDSSKQDSGYSSATPRSAESGELLSKCRLCNKSRYRSYIQSTPEYVCSCKKRYANGSSPSLECMEVIKEVKMSPTPKLHPRLRSSRPLELYEDVMDTSLYPEEMDVDQHYLPEHHNFSLDFSELGEEKSIDFVEPHVFSATEGGSKEMPPIDLASHFPPNLSSESGNSQEPEKQESKFFSFNTETSFSPEVFNCDLVSPKIKNESTPTKSKRGTPPMKVKKSTTFYNSAKKVATMSKVIKSFFPLNGIENVDILYQLGVKRGCQPIVEQIFRLLSEKDLDTVRVVSKTWNKLLCDDSAAYDRWQLYCTKLRLMKENLSSPVKQGGSGGRRPALTRLQNIPNQTSPSRSPQHLAFSPPPSPGSTLFRSYQRAAKTLKKDERLLPCPKCRFPSTDRGSPVLQCPRSGCRHRFCVWCNIEVLPDLHHTCPPLYTPRCHVRKNTVHSAGSKASKRNLRRL